jgi:predicted transcriptional regulator
MMVRKNSDGSYGLTPLGNLILSILEGLFFVAKDTKYFLQHDLSCLPSEYISRIGELSAGTCDGDVMSSFNTIEVMIREAEDHVWIITPQILPSATQILPESIKKGLEFKVIFPEQVVPPPGARSVLGSERRVLDKVQLAMIITEKGAAISLPRTDGSIDYIGYGGNDSRLLAWAHDLFQHFWERAIPTTQSPVRE